MLQILEMILRLNFQLVRSRPKFSSGNGGAVYIVRLYLFRNRLVFGRKLKVLWSDMVVFVSLCMAVRNR